MVLVLRSREIPRGCRKPPSQTVWSAVGNSCTHFPRAVSSKLCAMCPTALRGHRQQGLPGAHSEGSLTWHLPVALGFPESLVSRPLSAAQSLVTLIPNHTSRGALWITALRANGSLLHKYLLKWNGGGWLPQGCSVHFVIRKLSDVN